MRSACQSVSQTITFFSLSLSLSALVLRMDGWMRNRVLPYFDFNMPTVFFSTIYSMYVTLPTTI